MKQRSPESEKLSRRQLLFGLGSSAAVIATGAHLLKQHIEETGTDLAAEPIISEIEDSMPEAESIEDVEVLAESPIFDQVLTVRELEAGGLRRDQVLFVDAIGRPVGNGLPVTLSDAAGYTPEEMVWRYKGDAPVGISPVWSRAQKEILSHETGIPADEIFIRHVYLDLKKDEDEDTQSRIEMVYRNANMVVPGLEEPVSVSEFITTHLDLSSLDLVVAEEFRPYIVGIAAEESRFKNDKTSTVGAVGMLQTMPDTVLGYMEENGIETLDPRDITEQIKVASYHIEKTYTYLRDELWVELDAITQAYFAGDELMMKKYFFVPLIINAYNAGQGRMKQVVQEFLKNYIGAEAATEALGVTMPLTGYDVFFAMSHLVAREELVPRYLEDASTYVEKVIGWKRAFDTFAQNEQLSQ